MAITIPTTKKDINKLYRTKYGLKWNPICASNGQPVAQRPDVFIEQEVLRFFDTLKKHPGNLLLSWEEHFEKFVSMIWDNQHTQYRFTWNPYAKRMLREAVAHRFLGVSGHASSGKSQFGSIWGLANFLISPDNTRVLVTSTSLQESRLRIWGVTEKYWGEAETYFARVAASLNAPPSMPGKLVTSSGKITGFIDGKVNDLVGIALIAGGKGNDGDASTKIGFKATGGKLILVADELPLLTHKLYDATSNLLSVDGFSMLATGNFSSAFDPFGAFTEPEDGWSSITEDMYEWKTRIGGYCIRFDGEQSPNVLAKKEIYPGLLTEKGLQEIRERNGEKSPAFYRMIKSFPCPTGQEQMIYSEPELIGNFADHTDVPWLKRPTPMAFLDPSFSTGGDAAAATFALLGDAQIAGKTITILKKVTTMDLMMKVNAQAKDYDRNEQLADLFIEECDTRGVAIEDRGIDATGSGDSFATILATKMGKGFQMVQFGGAASDRAVSLTDPRPGKERFTNKVSELWYVGKEYVLAGQIRGLDPETILQLINRSFKNIGNRVQVEPKEKMKERTGGRSPDRADSWVGVLEVARRRYKFMSGVRAAARPVKTETTDDWFDTPKEDKGKKFRDFFSTDVGFHNQGNFAWGEDFH